MKKKVIIILAIILILIVIFLIIFRNNRMNNQTENTQNVIENNTNEETGEVQEQEANQMVIEVGEPEEEPWQWQHDALENHNIDVSVLNSVHNTIDSYPIHAEVIIKDGVIVDEYYKEGYNETSVFTLQSTSKSITSAIFGIAIDKGYIEGVNVPISTYFPQILDSGSEYKNQITNWNLLTHTTGLDASDTANWNDWLASSNWVDYVLNRRALARPGTVFNYFTGNTHLLSAIIQQATGKTTYEFGKEYLFDPLDIDSVECTEDPQGISDGGNGFAMNVYDMAKIGELYLNDGVWNGEQIIPAQWVEDSTTVQFDRSSGSADYGYQWWVRTFGNNNYPSFFAQGHYGQYIFVVPDLELVVVFTSHYEGSSSIYWQLMNQIVNAKISEKET